MKKMLIPLLLCLLLPCAALAESLPTLNLPSLMDLLVKNKGKVVVINFFATWCPPCRIEIPELITVMHKMAGKDVVFYSFSVDEKAELVPPYVKKMKMDYPVYLVAPEVARAYRVSSIPHNVIYDKTGALVFSQPGVAEADSLEEFINHLLSQK